MGYAVEEKPQQTPIKDEVANQEVNAPVETPTGAVPRHNPLDPSGLYSPDHQRERNERQARRDVLKEYRKRIETLPLNHLWEIPGRPNVVFSIRDYSRPSQQEGRRIARDELPFLFKAFELGQKPPPRPGTKRAEAPRAATIHEYLDWTVTASEPEDPDELDFAGFRVLVLLPRFKLLWPPPTVPYSTDVPLKYPQLGAPAPPIPHLQAHLKPICAATIRIGPSWIEVPFYATQETRRNKGNGRALLESIEDICRHMNIPRILLCSTDDPKVKATWQRLGFSFTTKEQLDDMGVTRHDLLHMDNTVQMHKDVSAQQPWKRLVLKHGDFKQRMYYLPGGGNVAPVPSTLGMKRNGKLMGGARKVSKPPKKRKR